MMNLGAATALVAAISTVSAFAQDQQPTWLTSCISVARGTAAQCSMQHTVTIEENGQVLFNVLIRTAIEPDIDPYLDVTGPIGFYLPEGLRLQVDGEELLKLAVDRCDANGCYTGAVLSPDQMDTLSNGQLLEVSFSPGKGQEATVALPLDGFAEAFESIKNVSE